MFRKIGVGLAAALVVASTSAALPRERHVVHPDALGLAAAGGAQAGRQIEAPSWSFACTTDHGPSRCGEPIWAYGRVD
jgi:hypothetical protein